MSFFCLFFVEKGLISSLYGVSVIFVLSDCFVLSFNSLGLYNGGFGRVKMRDCFEI